MNQLITTSRVGAFGILRFIFKHYYIFLIIFSLLPGLIVSINIAKETNNPTYPFVSVGISVFDADSKIYEYSNILKENPEQLLGVKPEIGIWNNVKYYWGVFLVVWALLGLIFMITFPFTLTYKIVRFFGDNGQAGKNIVISLIISLGFIFLMNLIITIYGMVEGSAFYQFEESWDIYRKVGHIIYLNIPFHGMYSLGEYLVSLI
jgi:hypothetical protein